ncbi:MAG: aminodeoxychorismate synthase component I [Candidatus Omnitrophica bacterium]|nr:aminodeoxychorismate synthase component I [Candidatus Omnitrophota bacterium]
MNFFKPSQPYVFLETLRFDQENRSSFLFYDFVDQLKFYPGDNPEKFFKKAEAYLDKGFWLSGYFSYEFGYCLEPALRKLVKKNRQPLAWLGVSKKPKNISKRGRLAEFFTGPAGNYQILNLRPNISRSDYLEQIKKIKSYLEQGFGYQVNFTFKVKFDFSGSPLACYLNLRRSQPSSYAALINTGQSQVISLSPELFFRINGRQIIARPMKGTIKRGLTIAEDERLKQELKLSPKTKAENIMIVDLLRNDLGRIAKKISVSKLFEVEPYRTLHQMTSTINGRLKNNLRLKELFSSLFPSGSVTGAPKIKTMQIIDQLEKEPRGIYTGAIGYISPKRESCFNVAIRTLSFKDGHGEMGVGGGIVYDSLGSAEYQEALLKAKFFVEGFPELKLIETLLLANGRYSFLNQHLERIKRSSGYFSIPLDIAKIKAALNKAALSKKGKFKVRLLLDLEGKVEVEVKPLEEISGRPRVMIASQRIDPGNRFLYHKTTQRSRYDLERKKALKQGFFEVIFLNTRGELTEGSISNIFILKGKTLYTPPLACGLLPGVLREHLLKSGKAKEKILYRQDLLTADKVYIGNSLRGLMLCVPEDLSTD